MRRNVPARPTIRPTIFIYKSFAFRKNQSKTQILKKTSIIRKTLMSSSIMTIFISRMVEYITKRIQNTYSEKLMLSTIM